MSSLAAAETDDIADDLRAAFAEASNDTPAIETPLKEAAAEGDGPSRDDHGRFAPKVVDKPQDAPQIAQADTSAGEPAKAISPPHSWTAAAKSKFATLDPDIQAEVLRREKEMQEGLDQWAPKGEVYNKFEALVSPIRDRLSLAGINEFQYFGALQAADNLLRTNPIQGLLTVAQQYGIQPAQLAAHLGVQLPNGPQAYAPQPQMMDPALIQMQQQLAELTHARETDRAAQEEARTAEMRAEIDAFRNDPANIYFDNVIPKMQALLKAGEADTIADAYDMAIHADKTIRGLIAQQAGKPQPGKPNGANVTGSPGLVKPGQKASDPSSSLEDDIRNAFNEVSGRV